MKTVIEMAREAGFTEGELAFMGDNFLRFADLVRAETLAEQPARPQEMPNDWFKGMPEEYRREAWRIKEQPAQQQQKTLRPEDVIVEVFTLHSSGGFAPLKTHGVKLTHKPTGIVVQCSSERSQHRNREQALRDLERYLYGARPQPTPQRKPLTKDQIAKFYGGDSPIVFQIIRDTEAAHGIKENT